MAFLEEIRNERLRKIQLLQKRGIDPYPTESDRSSDNATFLATYDCFLEEKTNVTLAGRIMSLRNQGGIAFTDIFDGTARVQTLLKKDDLGDEFDFFLSIVDIGDFVEVAGTAFTTNRGVNSLQASSWKMLTKSLRPIPDEWFGLKDEDERYRKRYIDLLLNRQAADLVHKRSVFWNSIRTFMLERNFVEVETPVLEPKNSGARAKQFSAHHSALDIEVYLRISPELWHKQLMVAGFSKVFEIGRVFRNEGMSYEHAQDYTVLEFYEAYLSSENGLRMVIDLLRHAAESTFGTLKFSINEFNVDLANEWKREDFNEVMWKTYGFDFRKPSANHIKACLERLGIISHQTGNVAKDVGTLWSKVRENIGGPVILTGVPTYLAPLGKKSLQDEKIVDEFKLLLGGNEIGHCFNELNDPIDQASRFTERRVNKRNHGAELDTGDQDLLHALEFGMPPTFGLGVSERYFSFLANMSIREAQTFPLMKPR